MLKSKDMQEKTDVQDLLKETYDEYLYCIECGAMLDRSDRKCYQCGAFQD